MDWHLPSFAEIGNVAEALVSSLHDNHGDIKSELKRCPQVIYKISDTLPKKTNAAANTSLDYGSFAKRK